MSKAINVQFEAQVNFQCTDEQAARLVRIGMVQGLLLGGMLTETGALSVLRGPLSPGDDSTIVDDSGLLHLDPSEAVARIMGEGEGK
jgi:hypothetical protein